MRAAYTWTWWNRLMLFVVFYLTLIDRNGGWSEWGNWTECSVSCEGGTRMRSRVCDNPTTEGSGADCVGDDTDTEQCNTQRCPCMLS